MPPFGQRTTLRCLVKDENWALPAEREWPGFSLQYPKACVGYPRLRLRLAGQPGNDGLHLATVRHGMHGGQRVPAFQCRQTGAGWGEVRCGGHFSVL